MKDFLKKNILLLSLCGIEILGIILLLLRISREHDLLGSSTQNKVSSDVIATPTASTSINSRYESTTVVFNVKYMENLHLDIRYSPPTSSANRYALILVEGSNDGGVNYFPVSSKVIGTDEIDLYSSSTLNVTEQGLPIIVPGNKITFGSSTYQSTYDADIVADFIKLSVKEFGAGSGNQGGYIYIRSSMTSKE